MFKIECRVDDSDYLPKRANARDAGADLRSTQSLDIYPGETKLIDTGVAVKIPEGFAGFVFNRSGQGKKQIILLNGVGVIDSDYRGNIKVALKNISDDKYEINIGDRIAQLVIIPIITCDFVDSWNDTKRGTGGFGSTGK
ncbi:MAG: dUTP diphosphatase [Betaproteobacteria bacterium]|nr:dUTP diphosphatase [bacterium]NDC04513.1 dUTP diphosphatase [Betaproteobacteria bacterium]